MMDLNFLSRIKVDIFITKNLTRPLLVAILCTSLFSTFAYAANSVVDDMDALINQGQFQQAYDLGRTNLFDLEGEAEFDFLYGLAALEVGHPDEAVFAFERIAFNYSDQQRVKLELARAYFMSNSLAAADSLFKEVLATNPEPNVVNNIQAFLAIIEQRQNSFSSSFNLSLTSALGSDSNINSATDLGIIDTPIGNIELNEGGQSIDDDFLEAALQGDYLKPLNKNSALSISANYNRHNNFSTDQFDLDIMYADLAYITNKDSYQFSTILRTQRVDLDRNVFQKSNTLFTTLQHSGSEGWYQTLTGAYSAIRYDTKTSQSNNLRDINQILVSGSLGKSTTRFNHNVNVFFGDDQILRDQGKNNATKLIGIAFSEQYRLSDKHMPYLRVSLNKIDNKDEDPIFNIKRKGKTLSSSLGWIWQAHPSMNITADITYTDSESTIELYTYDKLKYQAALRYQF